MILDLSTRSKSSKPTGRKEAKGSYIKRLMRSNDYKRKMPYSKDLIKNGLMDQGRKFIYMGRKARLKIIKDNA